MNFLLSARFQFYLVILNGLLALANIFIIKSYIAALVNLLTMGFCYLVYDAFTRRDEYETKRDKK